MKITTNGIVENFECTTKFPKLKLKSETKRLI